MFLLVIVWSLEWNGMISNPHPHRLGLSLQNSPNSHLSRLFFFFHLPDILPMTTLIPREPYSEGELDRLYPKGLQLQLVQVVCVYFPLPSLANLL